uniref:C9orf68 homolog n=1 Tax=Caligus clemensi TaxID=344056 RepID=C1C0T4_CALCM|nr:C9orf68 homolog [Caligus clemensi]
MAKSLRLTLDMEIHAVTCPGVWFSHKGPIYLSVCFLGFHVRTKPFPPTFPLLFGDKFLFEKTFPGVSSLQGLEDVLRRQPLYLELLQEIHSAHESDVVLASFETSGYELLFPYPQLRPSFNSGIDVDLLLIPRPEFPGIISPKVEVSTRCNINETRHPILDQHHDNAVIINQIPPMSSHPHIPPRSSSQCGSHERDPFVVRRVDEDLIGRRPTQTPPPPMRRSIHRSKSMVNSMGQSTDADGPPPCYRPRGDFCHNLDGQQTPGSITPPSAGRGRPKHRPERSYQRPSSRESGNDHLGHTRVSSPASPHHSRHIYFSEEERDNHREEEAPPSPACSHHDNTRCTSSQTNREDIHSSQHHSCTHTHRHLVADLCHCRCHSRQLPNISCSRHTLDCCGNHGEEVYFVATPHLHSSQGACSCSTHCCSHHSH